MSAVVSQVDDPSRQLRLMRAGAGELVHPPGTRVGLRLQRDVMLLLVQTGRLRLRVDGGVEVLAPARSVCLLRPAAAAELRFDEAEPTEQVWVRGQLDAAGAAARARFAALPAVMPLSAALSYLAREATLAERNGVTAGGALLDALATAALWQFIAEAEAGSSRRPAALERARRHIHRELERPLRLAEIAAAAAVTPPHLVRMFREHLGTTPMRYLWDRRVSLGVELLQGTGAPVGVVAERCGFKTTFHFSRRIRQATGLSPTQLRARTHGE